MDTDTATPQDTDLDPGQEDDDSNVILTMLGKISHNAPVDKAEQYRFRVDAIDDEASISDVICGVLESASQQTRLDASTLKEINIKFI